MTKEECIKWLKSLKTEICGYSTYDDDATKFCPNCGKEMKGVKHEID